MKRACISRLAVALALTLVAARPTWSQMGYGPYANVDGFGSADEYLAANGSYPYAGPAACGGGQCSGPGMCGPGDHCGFWDRVHQPNRLWLALEYVGMRMEGAFIPPLLTTSPAGTPQGSAGVLPDAQVVFGNTDIADDLRNGAQVRLGWWLVDGQFLGVEAHYMGFESEETSDTISSTFSSGTGGPILARPFIDAATGTPAAQLVAFPNFQSGQFLFPLDGTFSVDFDSDFQSAGVILRHVLWADFEHCFRLDVLGGYRFVNLDENLLVRSSVVTPPLAGDPAIVTETTDSFDADNDFHGGEVGLLLEMFSGRWSVEMLGKCALGVNHQEVTIDGFVSNSAAGVPPAFFPGGFLALPSNIGVFDQDEFAVIPEAHVKVKYDLWTNFRLTAGYRFIYLSEVVRPGDQIDLNITTAQLPPAGPGPPGSSPMHTFNSTSMWMHGVDVGVEWLY